MNEMVAREMNQAKIEDSPRSLIDQGQVHSLQFLMENTFQVEF